MANNPVPQISRGASQDSLPHRIQATIDLGALKHNLEVARLHAKGGHVVAVVKANAYGHGLVAAAEALHEADLFAVTDVEEAERLRQAGIEKGILILQGIIGPADLPLILQNGYQPVIHRGEDLQLLEEAVALRPPKTPLTLWLKLDSGMGRLGLTPEACVSQALLLRTKAWVKKVVLVTHIASASDPEARLNKHQLAQFEAVHAQIPWCSRSIASSAGLLALDCATDWNRPGIMLYGSSPFSWQDTARRREIFDLKAVMTLQARLISIKDHQAGDSIGYNSQFVCDKATRVGTISCGYADGYPSLTPNGAPVAVDLSDFPDATLGMPVELWGNTVSLDEVAAHTGILSYNLTCSITTRVPKCYA
jgi:alanine racemase